MLIDFFERERDTEKRLFKEKLDTEGFNLVLSTAEMLDNLFVSSFPKQ